jgi:PTH1 family peptidyl-tRNA hydrolase
MSAIQLIVGLANPGKKYEKTRHNAGAWFVEALAHTAKITLKSHLRYHGLYGEAAADTPPATRYHLLIPTTFMNDSGRSVLACARYHHLEPQHILIVHDDIDLPAGTAKLKLDGGDGGHNGLKDIIAHLHTKQFYRLRIGVGRPQPDEEVADYVLSPPSREEKQLIQEALVRAQTIAPYLFQGEIQKAMCLLHTTE